MKADLEAEEIETLTALEYKRRREARRATDSGRDSNEPIWSANELQKPASSLDVDDCWQGTSTGWEERSSLVYTNHSSVLEESLARIDASLLEASPSRQPETPPEFPPDEREEGLHNRGPAPCTHIPGDLVLRRCIRMTLRFVDRKRALECVHSMRRLHAVASIAESRQARAYNLDPVGPAVRAMSCYCFPAAAAGPEQKRAWSWVRRLSLAHRALHEEEFDFQQLWHPGVRPPQRDTQLPNKSDGARASQAGAAADRRLSAGLSPQPQTLPLLLEDLAGWNMHLSTNCELPALQWWQQRISRWRQAFLPLYRAYRRAAQCTPPETLARSTGFHVVGDHYWATFGWILGLETAPRQGNCGGDQKKAPSSMGANANTQSMKEEKQRNLALPFGFMSHTTERVRNLLDSIFAVQYDVLGDQRSVRPAVSPHFMRADATFEKDWMSQPVDAARSRSCPVVVRGAGNVQGLFELLLHFGPWLFSNTDVPLLLASSDVPFMGASLVLTDYTFIGDDDVLLAGDEVSHPFSSTGPRDCTPSYSVTLEFKGPLSPFAMLHWEAFLSQTGAAAATLHAETDKRTLMPRGALSARLFQARDGRLSEMPAALASRLGSAWQHLEAWPAPKDGVVHQDAYPGDALEKPPSVRPWCFLSKADRLGLADR